MTSSIKGSFTAFLVQHSLPEGCTHIKIGESFYTREEYSGAVEDALNRAAVSLMLGNDLNRAERFFLDIVANLASFESIQDAAKQLREQSV